MKLVLATNNLDKIREIKSALADLPVEILAKKDFTDFPEIPETADTLTGNAILKAKGVFQTLGLPTLADDTGLEVDALGGAPGVYSARFAGEDASYEDNCRRLLSELEDVAPGNRTARFRTVIAICWGDETEHVVGVAEGEISQTPSGDAGFGYDPVFYYPPAKKTFAEMTLLEKNAISHRGKAIALARQIIAKHLRNSTIQDS